MFVQRRIFLTLSMAGIVANCIQGCPSIFQPRVELRDLMLVYQFLHTLEVEWSILLPETAGGLGGTEFSEFHSVKDIAYLSIVNSVHSYVKYSAEELYKKENLDQLIWYLSEVLCVANVIEPTLGSRIWRQACETSINANFYYYMAETEEKLEKFATNSKSLAPLFTDNSLVQKFRGEAEKLATFFESFVPKDLYELQLAKINSMCLYMGSRDIKTLISAIQELIALGVIQSEEFLVGQYDHLG